MHSCPRQQWLSHARGNVARHDWIHDTYGRLQVHKAKLLNPRRWANAPKDGIVAVKVQYPDALQVMIQDLSNIRVAARFLEVRGVEAPSKNTPRCSCAL